MNHRTGSVLRWLLLAAIVCGDVAVAGICCLTGPSALPSADACCEKAGDEFTAYAPDCACDAPQDCTGCKWFSTDRAHGHRHTELPGRQAGPALQPHVPSTCPLGGDAERSVPCDSAAFVSRSPGPPVSRGPPLA